MHHDFHVHVHRAAIEGVVVHLVPVAVAGAGRVVVLVVEGLVGVVIVVEEHHFFVLVAAAVGPAALAVCEVVVGGVLGSVILQFLQLVRVRRPYELTVHVEDLTLWIHQKFSIIALDLNTTHDNIVLHIHTNLFIRRLISFPFSLSRLAVEAVVAVFYDAVVVEGALRIIIVLIIDQTTRLIL